MANAVGHSPFIYVKEGVKIVASVGAGGVAAVVSGTATFVSLGGATSVFQFMATNGASATLAGPTTKGSMVASRLIGLVMWPVTVVGAVVVGGKVGIETGQATYHSLTQWIG